LSRPPVLRPLALSLLLLVPLAAQGKEQLSDVLRVPRPAAGEWFGLYLVDKKVGWSFARIKAGPKPGQVTATEEFFFKTLVGDKVAERHHTEERIYESRAGGRLLSFLIRDAGDGGDQVLEGHATQKGFTVRQTRPGYPDETHSLPPVAETVETADQIRVALLRGKEVTGTMLDGTDLKAYRVVTTPGPEERRVVNGVSVLLRRATFVSDKEKVSSVAVVAPDGGMMEFNIGPAMIARAEPKSVAQRLDRVEIFGLTRVVLPAPPPPTARDVPGQWTLTAVGFPERFQRKTERQTYRNFPDGRTEVTIRAAPPDPALLKPRGTPTPPEDRQYLESTILVESNNPAIRSRAKKIAGNEKDAYAIARKVVDWVGKSMTKDYGASADRATDVLRTLRGDCTEHSLLSIALLRALGIPARRVDGMVYVQNGDGVPALYWHEWVEAWVGTWTQLDPTFGQPVADATHLALGEESSAEIMPLLGQLKVTASH
jgi:Transglutaminase-like superfamily